MDELIQVLKRRKTLKHWIQTDKLPDKLPTKGELQKPNNRRELKLNRQ